MVIATCLVRLTSAHRVSRLRGCGVAKPVKADGLQVSVIVRYG
jgi:hypothetical protein